MSEKSEQVFSATEIPGVKQKFSQLLFRIWPYWPIVIILLILGIVASFFYMKNATRKYEIRAQVYIDDETKNKNTSLNKDYTPVDQFSQLNNVDKQIEILKSKALLEGVIEEQNFNLKWTKKTIDGTEDLFNDLPIILRIDSSDNLINVIED